MKRALFINKHLWNANVLILSYIQNANIIFFQKNWVGHKPQTSYLSVAMK